MKYLCSYVQLVWIFLSNFLKLIIDFVSLETLFPVFPERNLVLGASEAISEIFFFLTEYIFEEQHTVLCFRIFGVFGKNNGWSVNKHM